MSTDVLISPKGPKYIVCDIDGTMTTLDIPNPDRRVDHVFKESIAYYHNECRKLYGEKPHHVMLWTGRDMQQVRNGFDGELPPYPVISSNGAELFIPGREPIYHQFSQAELDLLKNIREEAIAYKMQHPELYIETTKPFEIGFHFKQDSDYDEFVPQERIDFLGNGLLGIMHKYLHRAEKLGLPFRIEETEVTHRCFNLATINKISGFFEFAHHLGFDEKPEDMSRFVYCGDTFTRGNDRETAIFIAQKGGMTIQNYNDDHDNNIPDLDDPASPHIALPNCRILGQMMRRWTRDAIKIMSQPRM